MVSLSLLLLAHIPYPFATWLASQGCHHLHACLMGDVLTCDWRLSSSPICLLAFHAGFESGESSELLPPALPYAPIPPAFSPVEFYQPANSYWVDEYSLYHSALIYPPPVLDAATSFSDPYLRQTSRVRHESTQSSTSPVKPLPSTKRQPNEPDSDDVFI